MKWLYIKLLKIRFILVFGIIFQLNLIANAQPLTSVIGTINGDTVVCESNVFSIVGYGFFGSGNYTKFLWTGDTSPLFDINSQLPGFSTSVVGTYHLTFWVWDDIGDSASSNLSITVLVLPDAIISANGPTTFCQGGSVLLSSVNTPGLNYQWRKGNNDISGANTSDYTATQSGTYRLRITSVNGCSKLSNPIIVTVNPAPIVISSNDGPVCNGDDVHLTASGGTSYQWSGPGGFFSNLQNPIISGIALIGNGTYTVTVTSGAGCPGISTTNVIVNPLPNIIAGSNAPICSGNTLNLTSSGGITYSWSGPNSFVSNLQNPSISNITIAANGIYNVTVTNVNGCSNFASFNVNINGSPAITVNNPSICFGTTATLTASGGTTYTWNTGSNQNPLSVTPLVNTSYTVTGTSLGCSSSAIANVTVNPRPVVSVNSVVICNGSFATLTASGATTYSWSNGSTENPLVVSPNITTSFTVTGTELGCSGTEMATVTVNPSPIISVNNPTICSGNSATIIVSGANSYLWSNGSINNSITVSPLATTTYTVTGTSNACSSIAISTISVNPLPSILINNLAICNGASATITAIGATTYLWNNGETTSSIVVSPNITTSYSVTGTSIGCSSSAVSNVTVSTIPSIIINSANICIGEVANLIASGATTYLWNNGATSNSISVSPVTTTNYTVTGTTNGCTGTAISTVTVDLIPVVSVNNLSICSGAIAILTANGANSYIWDNGSTTNSISVSPIVTTNYTVTGTSNGCSSVAISNITVNPSLNLSVNNLVICNGSIATLIASGANSYLWNDGSTTDTIFVSPTTSTSYSVTGTSFGCSSSAISNVSVFNLPTDPISASVDRDNICSNDNGNIVLTVNGGSGNVLNWYIGTCGGTLIGSGNNLVIPSPTLTTTYYASWQVPACGNSNCVSITVNIISGAFPPTTVLVDRNDFCADDIGNITLTANGGSGSILSWYNNSCGNGFIGNGQSLIIPSPNSTTTYFVRWESLSCGNSSCDSITVNVNPMPIADAGNDTTIILGTFASLIANGSATYLWNTGENTSNILVSPLINTVYFVSVTNIFGCTSIDSVTVFVNPNPVVDAGFDDTICAGEGVLLTATGIGNFSWSTGETTQTIFVNPIITTTYFISLNVGGFSATDSVSVFVNPTPIAFIGNDTSLCEGQSLTLNASGIGNYLWSTGDSSASISVTPTTDTVYTLVVSQGPCGAIADILVYILPVPNLIVSNDTTICNGNNLNLSATGIGICYWSNGMLDNSITVSPSVTSIYSVTISNIFGCQSSDSIIVNVLPFTLPVINSNGPIGFCDSSQVNAILSLTDIYMNYTWSNGDTSSVIIVNNIGSFNVSVSSANGCAGISDTITILVYPEIPNPVILSDSPTEFCQGDSAVLYLNNDYYIYFWNSGSFTPAIQVNESGNYQVTVSSFYGCTKISAPMNVDVNPIPSADFSYSDNYLSIQLYDFSLNADAYLWDFGDGQTSTTSNPSHTYAVQGTYTFSLIVMNDCGIDTTFATITLPSSNGIVNQDEITNFKLYPNPATSDITLSYESGNLSEVEINIFNPIGQTIMSDIYSKQSMKFKKTININNLSDGVYIMEIKENNFKTMKKFVKH